MKEFTHIDEDGAVRMVDVTDKAATDRRAVAEGRIVMNRDTFERITDTRVKKGNVLETARIAGVMAAKRTSEVIPMCHPLFITGARVDFYPEPENHAFRIEAEVRVKGETGVEMEALHAVSVAALTIYDMCKAYDKGMTIEGIRLMAKSGGKSGVYQREGA
ncbi:cyclic pyranopterin monophosphate synthase MoaC [Desulfoluna butyratoxydans]|uniref:Cyclic pyranopterin monophosphate synthase n=1 Tax=Desulfoluna butyratoxydans TaxID=231438 RepID=A0A4U8YJC0_9BACT|nr:cyclic pyranopterin monophosphate synthase MoaC [Desulfoluna butyratoxydans]VFQ43835.1 molybdenum cofactor biosynthesis c [Desulfoluna butyratoxydans]